VQVLHSGRLLALPANVRLGWKSPPGTLAYYEKAYITAVKSFITLATVVNALNLFSSLKRTTKSDQVAP
jgi:hypothetical protein